jgi:hypothetical protein
MSVANTEPRFKSCPICDAVFIGWSCDYSRPHSIEYDGAILSPLLAGRTVVEHEVVPDPLGLVLEPCGCHVSPKEWQLCQTARSYWFARPNEVEAQILAVMAEEAKR